MEVLCWVDPRLWGSLIIDSNYVLRCIIRQNTKLGGKFSVSTTVWKSFIIPLKIVISAYGLFLWLYLGEVLALLCPIQSFQNLKSLILNVIFVSKVRCNIGYSTFEIGEFTDSPIQYGALSESEIDTT